jgi:hypothetical protein
LPLQFRPWYSFSLMLPTKSWLVGLLLFDMGAQCDLKRSGNMPKVTASNGRASNSTPGLTQTPCSFHSHTASRVNKDAVNPVSVLSTHKLEVTTRKLVS